MNRDGVSWWEEIGGDDAPGIRWFTIIRLPIRCIAKQSGSLRMETGAEKGKVLPEPIISGNLAVPSPISQTGQIIISPGMQHPRGSVRLEPRDDAIWDQVGEPASRRPSGSGRSGIHTRFVPDNELPLWKRLSHLLRIRTDRLLLPDGPLKWPGSLFEYQITGIQALLMKDAVLLADDMGLGKTIQAIAALRILFLRRTIANALVIVPAGLLRQWRDEIERWAPELRVSTIRGIPEERAWQWQSAAHVYLVTYETFRSDFTGNPAAPPRRIWDYVILDEAQKIKNRESEISIKCKQIQRKRCCSLTGTPLENDEEELASILEFTALHLNGNSLPLSPGPGLRQLLRDVQLRRKKSDVLKQIPPKIVQTIALPMGRHQETAYREAERQGLIALSDNPMDVRVEMILALIAKLKQYCNFCPRTGQSAKCDDLEQRLQVLDQEGHRALIFSQFTDQLFGCHALAQRLHRMNPLVFTGALSVQQRNDIIQEFRMDKRRKILILSLRAGGLGLNLQDASYVFHFDRWWNPAVEQQAEARSHRMGQPLPVHVYKYILEDTIEERIDRILRKKQRLFDDLVDDVTMNLENRLGKAELLSLFGLNA